ncbi:sigma-70 family RNA polymerase sigma factor [Streptacidiphilus sp. 4-A2]|nr:sigma-70 family RNA polymerase sigma factor [Streptacidiphilus sp. 4-A2]
MTICSWCTTSSAGRGRASDTDDVVQETLLQVVSGLGALRDPASFRSWTVAIAMNQIRRRRRGEQPAQEPADSHSLGDPGADFAELTIVRLGLSDQRRSGGGDPLAGSGRRELLALWWLETAGELSRGDLAAAMELSAQHAAVRVQRMKGSWRRPGWWCGTATGPAVRPCRRSPRTGRGAQPLWRKRIGRHPRVRGLLAPAEGLFPAEGCWPVWPWSRSRRPTARPAAAGRVGALPGPHTSVCARAGPGPPRSARPGQGSRPSGPVAVEGSSSRPGDRRGRGGGARPGPFALARAGRGQCAAARVVRSPAPDPSPAATTATRRRLAEPHPPQRAVRHAPAAAPAQRPASTAPAAAAGPTAGSARLCPGSSSARR